MDAADAPAPVATLLENHCAFLSYLECRVGDRGLAEDILQDAFAKVSRLTTTLKPEYAEALQAVEMRGTPVRAFAEQKRLSANNAGVRLLRAREALKRRVMESCGTCAEHGCVNCTCRHS